MVRTYALQPGETDLPDAHLLLGAHQTTLKPVKLPKLEWRYFVRSPTVSHRAASLPSRHKRSSHRLLGASQEGRMAAPRHGLALG